MERERDIQITANLSTNQLESRLEKFRTDMKSMDAEKNMVQRYHKVWTKKFLEK